MQTERGAERNEIKDRKKEEKNKKKRREEKEEKQGRKKKENQKKRLSFIPFTPKDWILSVLKMNFSRYTEVTNMVVSFVFRNVLVAGMFS